MKLLVTILLLFNISIVVAGINTNQLKDVGWDELSETQKLDILQSVTTNVKQNQQEQDKKLIPDVDQIDNITKWATVGDQIGDSLVRTATHLGMTTNEFVKTPVGTIVIGLIIWKYLGSMIFHLFSGILVLIVGVGSIWWHNKYTNSATYTYSEDKVTWWGAPKLIRKTYAQADSLYKELYMLLLICILILTIWILFSY